ncbi:MAG: acetate kinase [Lentisphaeria bacterium]
MRILVLNAGSSSVKFTLFRMKSERMLAKGVVERIGLKQPNLQYELEDGREIEEEVHVADHDDALRVICDKLVDKDLGVIDSLQDVEAIGHRVVHGAEKFSDSVKVSAEVKSAIRLCSSLAPLHNPPNLGCIEACERVFPETPNIAVFDTAFHQSMPDYAYLYAIPHKYYEEHGIRKYGFHGTSHKYVAQATAKYLGRPLDDLKFITCHLGNGSSVAAIRNGQVLDTSMGMTPLMGLVMGTRCGDLDPGVLIHLLKKGMTVDELDQLLNKKSGLRGVATIGSGDMRDILGAIDEGNSNAECAFNMFVHRLVHYIGAYYTLLDQADAVVFTGGIGENSIPARTAVVKRLKALGCYPQPENQNVRSEVATLSTPESSLQAIVMPTNEELMIGRETLRLLNSEEK